jgi:hypothetical protein
MQFVDFKYVMPIGYASVDLRKEMDSYEYQRNRLCSINGVFPLLRIPKKRGGYNGIQCNFLHLSRPVSLHSFCSTNISGKPQRHPSYIHLWIFRTISERAPFLFSAVHIVIIRITPAKILDVNILYDLLFETGAVYILTWPCGFCLTLPDSPVPGIHPPASKEQLRLQETVLAIRGQIHRRAYR